jgi:hypothetical protein
VLLLYKADPARDTASAQEVGTTYPTRAGLTGSRDHDWVHHPLAHVCLELPKGGLGET